MIGKHRKGHRVLPLACGAQGGPVQAPGAVLTREELALTSGHSAGGRPRPLRQATTGRGQRSSARARRPWGPPAHARRLPLCPETRRRQAAATPCDGGGGQHRREGLAPTRRRVGGGSPGNGQPTWAPRALLCSPGSAGGPTTQRVPAGPVPMGGVQGATTVQAACAPSSAAANRSGPGCGRRARAGLRGPGSFPPGSWALVGTL